MEKVTKPQLPPKLLITDFFSSEVSKHQSPLGRSGFAWDGEQDRRCLLFSCLVVALAAPVMGTSAAIWRLYGTEDIEDLL